MSSILERLGRLMSEGFNEPGYKFYVVIGGNKIESGWEYKEDAKDQLGELPSEQRPGKVFQRLGLKKLGLDPENENDWYTVR